jgi:hypothetical protein
MQSELDLVWEKLLPAFAKDALPTNTTEYAKLKKAAANLTAHPAPPKKAK